MATISSLNSFKNVWNLARKNVRKPMIGTDAYDMLGSISQNFVISKFIKLNFVNLHI